MILKTYWIDTDEIYPDYIVYDKERSRMDKVELDENLVERYNKARTEYILARNEIRINLERKGIETDVV